MNVTISQARFLAAADVFKAKRDARYMLNGVCLAPCANGGVDIVATNGHNLLKIHDAKATGLDHEVIVDLSAEALRALKLVSNRENPVTLAFDEGAQMQPDHCTLLVTNGATFPFVVIDGKFPCYDTIIPTPNQIADYARGDYSSDAPAFNPELLVDYAKAHKILGGGSTGGYDPAIRLLTRGEMDATRVEFPRHDHVVGVVMPMRI